MIKRSKNVKVVQCRRVVWHWDSGPILGLSCDRFDSSGPLSLHRSHPWLPHIHPIPSSWYRMSAVMPITSHAFILDDEHYFIYSIRIRSLQQRSVVPSTHHPSVSTSKHTILASIYELNRCRSALYRSMIYVYSVGMVDVEPVTLVSVSAMVASHRWHLVVMNELNIQ